MPDKKTCFIIAPMSTPAERVQYYKDGAAHCQHVIEYLLVPAAKEAGFEAVPPAAKGSELIHSGIINNLQNASLVLCDMSCLNPNVFFELGMRTAQNRAISLTVDDVTRKEVPFDLGVINHHPYESDFIWNAGAEIEKLAKHIVESAKASNNALWEFFGSRIAVEQAESRNLATDEIGLVRREIEALRRELRENRNLRTFGTKLRRFSNTSAVRTEQAVFDADVQSEAISDEAITEELRHLAVTGGSTVKEIRIDRDLHRIFMHCEPPLAGEQRENAIDFARELGFLLLISAK